jgi:hypothetical protein
MHQRGIANYHYPSEAVQSQDASMMVPQSKGRMTDIVVGDGDFAVQTKLVSIGGGLKSAMTSA